MSDSISPLAQAMLGPGTRAQEPVVSDDAMRKLLMQMYIGATGGYNDQPLYVSPNPFEGRGLYKHELPGPIPNMTPEDFLRGYYGGPYDPNLWDRKNTAPRVLRDT